MFKMLNNLSVKTRMLISITLLFLTLLIALSQAYTTIEASKKFSIWELKGNTYQRPLAAMLHDAGQLRLALVLEKSGMNSAALNKETLITAISSNMDALQTVQAEIGDDLQFTTEGLTSRGREHLNYETVRAKWDSIVKEVNGSDKTKADELLVSLISDIRGMIAHSGDTSNLILDPDLDSYYIMDVTLLAMPQTVDRLSVIGSTLYAQINPFIPLAGEQAGEAAVMARMLSEADISRVIADVDVALKEDANFSGVSSTLKQQIEPALADYKTKNEALVVMIKQISAGQIHSQEEFLQTVIDAQNAASHFWDVSMTELDTLIQTRIDGYSIEQKKVLLISAIGVILSLMMFFLISNSLTQPMSNLTDAMRRLARNELDTQIPYTEARSEFGEMARALQVFKDNAQEMKRLEQEREELKIRNEQERKQAMIDLADRFDSHVQDALQNLLMSADDMKIAAEDLNETSVQTADASQYVASIAGQTDANVQTVASATEELSASSQEISQQVVGVAQKAGQAANDARKASETVTHLNNLTSSIGEVVYAIKDIADQTNLLALNATIEAARAGDAGRGFAVVADEVKKLAIETASKTEQINERVQGIEKAIKESVSAVEAIISNVAMIDSAATSVSAAVEEQNAATGEIGRNVSEVSSGTQQLAETIQKVSVNASQAGENSKLVLQAANDVSKLTEGLRSQINTFLSGIRA